MREAMGLSLVKCSAACLGEADTLLTENPCYTDRFSDAVARQAWWRQFLEGADEREATVAQRDWAIGDDGFRERMAVVLGRATPRRRRRPKTTSNGAISSQTVEVTEPG